jgi:predicted N-acetyltransferase YhbS
MAPMSSSTHSPDLAVRAATPDDDDAVLALLQASMGWVPDQQYLDFFLWKHRQSPFGTSPAWVATEGERIVGFRTFMRWQFERAGETVEAVRAVDTATHPDHQGRGIFSLLTRQALDELADQGVAFVFNTPNDRSRPGYLKMGWQPVGRLPVAARPRSPGALLRLARARTPADKWSAECQAGVPAAEAFSDDQAVAALLDRHTSGSTGALATRRTPAYLRWRYGFPPLHYRVITAPGGPTDGLVVFRVRRRGAATEAAICELLLPGEGDDDAAAPGNGDGARSGPHRRQGRVARKLLGQVLQATRADHAVWLGPPRWDLGLLPLPKQGPTLVWRAVGATPPTAAPPPADWHLTLGDVELF